MTEAPAVNPSDPSGFVTNPPSTIVKVGNTAREDVNGSLGIVVRYEVDRGRYLVHLTKNQSTVLLKPDNLNRASFFENYKGQFEQIKNDPRVRRELSNAYEKAKQALHPVKPEYAAGAFAIVSFLMVYLVGPTRALMATTLLLLLGVLVSPDILQGASYRTVLDNFPMRCREAIEGSIPALKGRLSNRMALGVVLVVLAFGGKMVLFSPAKRARAAATAAAANDMATTTARRGLAPEDYYKLGFEDATKELAYGTSLSQEPTTRSASSFEGDSFDDVPLYDTQPPPGTRNNTKFGYGSVMSAFMLYKTFKELGTDPTGAGGWDYQRALANFTTMEVWKKGLVAFSAVNLVRSFF